MNIGLTNIASNLKMSLEGVILLIAILCSLVFFAKDFKLGIIMLFITSGALFMMFYALHLNYTQAIIVFFMSFIIMALTLYTQAKMEKVGGIT